MSIADRPAVASLRMLVWLLLAIAGSLLWLNFVTGVDDMRAWRALLVNFLFFTSLAGGLVVWPAVVRSANGTWHAEVEGLAFSALGFAIPSILVLIVLWIGAPHWAPWHITTYHQGGWLNSSFVMGRNLVGLLIFWGVALRYLLERRAGQGRVTGGILIAVYAFVFSLLGMDLVMALDPAWSSTLAGAYFFMTALYIAILAWAFLAVWHPRASSEHRLDLGRLVVAFSMIATYLMYAHLLPIWYEALPHEVRFIVPRMNFQPWRSVSLVLIAVVYLGPLVLLLMERAKRNRWSLGIISLLLLAGMWVERWWLVVPTFHRDIRFGAVELSMLAGLLGLMGLGMELFLRRMPPDLLAEKND